ncbi:PTS system, beta-glucoside-specific, IIABC component [Enterococcus canis]|uniref:PTS system, beta-glucoside-specific, IIABC component n=1 Tax=Enterococcus canis TaxID=214095 RepID=A0A1L8RI97_9ENTE|nr:beta-glucoside-specific PTS transporter subunit IIABC [Enterococcus canis]OJG19476.1 PTS system, beta-glucoside-specific, IIABC component [Enterococcus canis]
MSKKYEELASKVIELTGEKQNITAAWHCVTRLRFNVQDANKVKIDDIKRIKGVMGAQFSGDQFQVIIGSDVSNAFDEVEAQLGTLPTSSSNTGGKKNIINTFTDTISSIFTPAMPALIGGGLLKGFLALMTAMNWLAIDSSAYAILNIIGDCAFYFMPFIIAVSSARRFKTNEYLALSVAGALLYPTMVNGFNMQAAGETVQALNLFGVIPIPYMNYSSSVIPIILATYVLSFVYKFVKAKMPATMTTMFTPMVSLLIVIPITLSVLGPLGTYVGGFLSIGIAWLFQHAGFVAGAVIGGVYPLLVMTGMHWALSPIMINAFAQQGFDNTMMPAMLAATFAMAGATFGVFLKTKNSEMKQLSLSSGISAVIGITEPAMYGVTLKLKRPFYAAMIAGGIAGAIFNLFNVKSFGMSMPGLVALAGYADPQNGQNMIVTLLGSLAAFLVAGGLTWILGFKEEEEKTIEKQTGKQFHLTAPTAGRLVPIETISDSIFAEQVMGHTVAVEPKTNKIVSPLNGEVVMIADTLHAIGLKGDDGVEVLVHLGIDTVELKGEGFTPKVKVGDKVKIGDALVDMDIKAIRKAGYETVVLMIVTNTQDYLKVLPINEKEEVDAKTQVSVAIN